MSAFIDALDAAQPDHDPSDRRWVFVPYDQLTDQLGPLAREPAEELGIVLVECPVKAARRPYHRRKLALILSNLRHFAVEQAQRGVAVRHVVSDGGYADALRPLADELGGLRMMEAAERELRHELADLVEAGAIEVLPHEGWLTTEADFESAGPADGPWRMDRFYRAVRKRTGWLMDDGSPRGGRFSHDGDNREKWSGEPAAPQPPTFPATAIRDEVVELVRDRFSDHPGHIEPDRLPATRDDAEALWSWVLDECMTHFGPYEDAMARGEPRLFHTCISEVLHLHRLLPERVVRDVATAELPVNSQEGFVRQVLGWREFVRHVHRATDGFRTLDPEAAPSHLGADRGLPAAFWGDVESGLACLDEVVSDVWRDGYSHHITRLMVLSNLATLLDVSPRELTDWFWVAYSDAYDWVVEPNVLGMGTFAAGPLMTTKPYVSGSAYIHRMSDYCEGCSLHPKKTCPITPMYWAFLERHADALADTRRMNLPLASMRKRSETRRADDRQTATRVAELLEAGERITAEALAEGDGSDGQLL